MRRRPLGLLLAAAALAVAGCGSSSSTTATAPPSAMPSGPVPGARVLPLVAIHGVAGPVSTQAMPRATPPPQAAIAPPLPGAGVQKRGVGAERGAE